jgi:hypothetical protein
MWPPLYAAVTVQSLVDAFAHYLEEEGVVPGAAIKESWPRVERACDRVKALRDRINPKVS